MIYCIQICLPYLDPALLQSRQQMFDLTYGFRCKCPSCQFMETLGHIPSPPSSSDELRAVAAAVREFVGVDSLSCSRLPSRPQATIPRPLLCVFQEAYLSTLSEAFSKASHDGQYDLALDSGLTLLAVYIMIYPANYPQIGEWK
jgi:hypothetical protein